MSTVACAPWAHGPPSTKLHHTTDTGRGGAAVIQSPARSGISASGGVLEGSEET
jgi:hypothetical protein